MTGCDPSGRVRQLRICLAHHSFIYYNLGYSVIADGVWDDWAAELSSLQDRYGYRFDKRYDRWFKDWDGTTGYELCSIPGLQEQAIITNPELFMEGIWPTYSM